LIWHDKYYFGLCAADLPVRGFAKHHWKAPTQAIYNANKRAIQQYENPTEETGEEAGTAEVPGLPEDEEVLEEELAVASEQAAV